MSEAIEIIGLVVTILGVAERAQVLADRLRIPGVLFSILADILSALCSSPPA